MKSVWQLEMRKFKRDPTLGGLGGLMLGLLALLFYRLCVDYLQLAHEHVAQSARTLSVSLAIIKPFCSWAMVLSALCIPLLTTNSISREYRQQTFILWATSQRSALEIVVGKWFSILILVGMLTVSMLVMIATLGWDATLDKGYLFSALLAVGLVGSALISFGLCLSSLISTPLGAMGVTCLGNILWILLEWIDPFPHQWQTLAENLSLLGHIDPLLNGIIRSTDLAYYIAITCVFLALTTFFVHQKMTRIRQ